MADFYFVYSVIDIVWKIFSILFVLYRFTSFFSMLYEFFKFLGKLLKGLIYVKDQIVIYIRKRNNYSVEEYDLPIRQESYFTKIYNKIFKRNENYTYLPLYETRTERTNNYDENESESEIFNFKNRDSIQSETFNKLLHSNITMEGSSDVFSQSYYDINTKINTSNQSSSIYPPPPPQPKKIKEPKQELPKQELSKQEPEQKPFNIQDSFNLLKSDFINNVLNTKQNEIEENEDLLEESDELDSLFKPNL
jgi:hypothetical protein